MVMRYFAGILVVMALFSCTNRGGSSKDNEKGSKTTKEEITQLDGYTPLACSNGYTISYKYDGKGALSLVLEKDGKILKHEMMVSRSGSGARYETKDGKFVFWEHHGDFSYFVNDKKVCSCVQSVKKSKLSTGNLYTVEYKSGDRVEIEEDNSFSASISSLSLKFDDAISADTLKLETDPVVDVLLNDIDGNGVEELLLVTSSVGSGGYGSVYGFVLSDNKVVQCSIPEITKEQLSKGALFDGYMGHDRFYVEEGKLMREFPIYKEGDSNAHPTGGKKNIQYTLTNNRFEILK
ncbi:hypothetical protein EYV94_02525 [Puteibacter caeruleilacunae]|nr:hypothetical protein EYV94_02525 [Puteibacter caeruleilacunae]